MRKIPLHILRVGLAITFIWIGVLIIMQPLMWGGYIEGWASGLIPFATEPMMLVTGVIDIVIGALLALGVVIPLAAALGALHIAIVLVVSGITDITVRDIGLLAAALALMLESLPEPLARKLLHVHE
ncbi:MAG TPA: hypothetical protein VJ579_03790 [Candidatus Paceibacterota bacterium]|nr:hypothetical protein [Candidatus Paceibacterota bacterium]